MISNYNSKLTHRGIRKGGSYIISQNSKNSTCVLREHELNADTFLSRYTLMPGENSRMLPTVHYILQKEHGRCKKQV